MLPRNHPDRLASEMAVSAAEWSSSEFAAFRKAVMIGTLVDVLQEVLLLHSANA